MDQIVITLTPAQAAATRQSLQTTVECLAGDRMGDGSEEDKEIDTEGQAAAGARDAIDAAGESAIALTREQAVVTRQSLQDAVECLATEQAEDMDAKIDVVADVRDALDALLADGWKP